MQPPATLRRDGVLGQCARINTILCGFSNPDTVLRLQQVLDMRRKLTENVTSAASQLGTNRRVGHRPLFVVR